MGMDCYAKAFVGLKVYKEDVFELKTVKAFEHNYPNNYKVDPINGKPLWKTVREMKPGFSDYHYEIQFGEYEVIPLGYDSGDYVIALHSVSTGSHRGGNLVGFKKGLPEEDEVEVFKNKLIEAELWNPDNFGIWVYTDIG